MNATHSRLSANRWRCAAPLAALLLISACAGTPSINNQPLVRQPSKESDYDFKNWIAAQNKLDNLIVLSFSGGGLRAATLAASVLDQLKDLGLTDKIAIISSTSGGSVTAGYFAAKGVEGMAEYRSDFLYNDNTSDLTPRLLPSFLSGANRSQQFADYLDERLFQHKPKPTRYIDLMERWKSKAPFVVLNASDASSGRTFEFTQESFSHICSDLSDFRISEAIAASAAFPFLMTPIPLANLWYEPKCRDTINPFSDKAYRDAVSNRYTNLEEFIRARYIHSLRYTFKDDPAQPPYRQIKYLHLIDGGLSDNLAARALLRTFSTETVDALQKKGARRILLVQVNAKSDDAREMDNSSEIPSWIEIFKTVALNPIDVTTELSSYVSKEYWVSLIRYVNAEQSKNNLQANNDLRFYPVQVDFDQIDTNPELQRRVKKIATNWSLPSSEVALIEETGKKLLTSHPCFKAFLFDAKIDLTSQASSPTGCDKIDVSAKVGMAPPPPPIPAMAAPPPPHPPAMKLSFSTDAFFDFDTATLSPGGQATLDALIPRLLGNEYGITVTGHTDRLGSSTHNQKLSEYRAFAVRDYLVKGGIAPRRIRAIGKSNSQPITKPTACVGDRSPVVISCLQPDRRVDIEIDTISHR